MKLFSPHSRPETFLKPMKLSGMCREQQGWREEEQETCEGQRRHNKRQRVEIASEEVHSQSTAFPAFLLAAGRLSLLLIG